MTTAVAETDTIVCADCGAAKRAATNRAGTALKLPMGWSRADERVVCRDCTRAAHPVHAINWTQECYPPEESAELVAAQMSAGHRYRNALVEIELRRRERVRALFAELASDIAECEARIEALTTELESHRQSIRKGNARSRNKTVDPRAKAVTGELKVQLRDCRETLKAAKARVKASGDFQRRMTGIAGDTAAEIKSARHASELYWGTYCAVEAAAKSFGSGTPPRFKRYAGDGRIAVQLQGGLSLGAALAGADTRLRLTPPDTGTKWWHCDLRVGSDGRAPVWTRVRFAMPNREFPEDARIKWAYLHRRKVAAHDAWSLTLTLERDSPWEKPRRATTGTVAVDLGWRLVPAGLRVAYWIGDDGASGELVLPLGERRTWYTRRADGTLRRRTRFAGVRALGHADAYQRDRDRNLEAAILRLKRHMAALDLPEWFSEATSTLGQWKSANRLAALAIRWRGNRFAGDEAAFAEVENWRREDKAVWERQAHIRRGFRAWRKQQFGNFCAKLRERYKTLAIEAVNWSAVREKRPAELDEGDDAASVTWRNAASVGVLDAMLRDSFLADRIDIDAENITRTCHACGSVEDWDRSELLHRCGECGERWDQDANACRNLLRAVR